MYASGACTITFQGTFEIQPTVNELHPYYLSAANNSTIILRLCY